MKFILVLVAFGVAAAMPQDEYKLDVSSLNVEDLLNNPERLKKASNCLLGLGECTALGEAVKKELPQALASGCARCSPAQKQVIRKILVTGRQQLPQETEQLIQKYDPEGQYRETIEQFLASTD